MRSMRSAFLAVAMVLVLIQVRCWCILCTAESLQLFGTIYDGFTPDTLLFQNRRGLWFSVGATVFLWKCDAGGARFLGSNCGKEKCSSIFGFSLRSCLLVTLPVVIAKIGQMKVDLADPTIRKVFSSTLRKRQLDMRKHTSVGTQGYLSKFGRELWCDSWAWHCRGLLRSLKC